MIDQSKSPRNNFAMEILWLYWMLIKLVCYLICSLSAAGVGFFFFSGTSEIEMFAQTLDKEAKVITKLNKLQIQCQTLKWPTPIASCCSAPNLAKWSAHQFVCPRICIKDDPVPVPWRITRESSTVHSVGSLGQPSSLISFTSSDKSLSIWALVMPFAVGVHTHHWPSILVT